MYVELVTRITVVELKPDEGLLREALNSLYSLFDTTRQILENTDPRSRSPKGTATRNFHLVFWRSLYSTKHYAQFWLNGILSYWTTRAGNKMEFRLLNTSVNGSTATN